MAKIKYERLPERVCVYCKDSYKPTGPAQLACSTCIRHIKNVNSQVYNDIAKLKKYGTIEGIGSGSTQGRGELHHSYKNGVGLFLSQHRYEVKKRRYCEDCNKDLQDANRWEWCCHHIDHDRTNNQYSNYKLLCKSCHAKEHNVVDNIKGITNEKNYTVL